MTASMRASARVLSESGVGTPPAHLQAHCRLAPRVLAQIQLLKHLDHFDIPADKAADEPLRGRPVGEGSARGYHLEVIR